MFWGVLFTIPKRIGSVTVTLLTKMFIESLNLSSLLLLYGSGSKCRCMRTSYVIPANVPTLPGAQRWNADYQARRV